MKEKIKAIEGFPDYFISDQGNVYSTKRGKRNKISTWVDSRNLYLLVSIIDECGERHNCLVHRLVAKAFIPNPNNLPEVNHKDKNTQNPKAENLEWCTRKENLEDSYKTMSSTRNFNQCKLYKDGVLIKEFQSISEAGKYANEKYGASKSSLEKYLRWKDLYIITENTNRQTMYDGKQHSTQNRNPIKLYKNDIFIDTFKTYREVSEFLKEKYNIEVSVRYLNETQKYQDFKLARAL